MLKFSDQFVSGVDQKQRNQEGNQHVEKKNYKKSLLNEILITWC